jgi:alpha-beta hydrolase superfamily lysophospholipase
MSERLQPQIGDMLSRDGTRLFYRWHPVADARASVVLVHGFAEHSGRYAWVMDRLNEAGFNAMAYDYRGHGHAEGSRVYIDRFSEYVDDARSALDFVEDRARKVPLFLLGHSQGGLISLITLLTQQQRLRGCVLSSPALGIAVPVPAWKDALGKVMARVLPSLAIPSGIDPNHLCRDTQIVADYLADPLVPSFARARWYVAFTEAQVEMERRAPEVTIPMLVLQGADDQIADPLATERVAGRLGAQDVTFQSLAGLRHEIFNEPERAEVLDDVVAWLEARL